MLQTLQRGWTGYLATVKLSIQVSGPLSLGFSFHAPSFHQRLAENRTAWESRQSELTESLTRLSSEREGIASQRGDLAATLDPSEVQQYEKLRNAKGGLAVAKVSRGLCQACRMALPTQQQQKVRNGRQTVLCSTCGRILFLT